MKRALILVSASLLLIAALFYVFHQPPIVKDTLPGSLSNKEFWQIVTDFSEAGGYFRSDNLLSNETGSQAVIPKLKKTVHPGGVYLGVGPEQNFTYILALESRIAFIVDIRRQNMLEHLLYKSFMETSQDRAEFLSKLFARPRPAGLTEGSDPAELFSVYQGADASTSLFETDLSSSLDYLEKTKGFTLSKEDEAAIRRVYQAFFESGPRLSYTFLGGYRGPIRMPTYADLMTETDGRRNWSYLATEDQFRAMQRLQKNNLIVPLVGDFAGPKAIRAVGKYLKQYGAVVGAFYTSNVEQYLFQDDQDWKLFYENVATLPTDSNSTFIRYVLNSWGLNRRSRSLWSSIPNVVKAYNNGGIRGYYDVVEMSQ